ncbi:hypothetical protein B7494_g3160 [Chlorociboria aeruginascens]|nr:hypothetical protein B7494_g3160 [Chlorociboria aeruginascens]
MITLLSPDVREPSPTEEYFSRSLGIALLTLGIMVILLTGSVPLTSSISDSHGAGVTTDLADPKAPYAVPTLTISTLYHSANALFCYMRYNTVGQMSFILGSLGSGAMAAMGLWCILFASSSGRISRKTGADKRMSGFPFGNKESASAKKKYAKGLTWRQYPQSEEKSIQAMKTALNAGCNFWNGGEFYGTPQYNSLHLLEKYFTKYPEDASKVVISIKGAINLEKTGPDGSPEGIRRSIDNCLKILNGKKTLDIFECARVDPKTPIEITLKVLDEEYVKTGKIGGIALSEVSAATIHRAAKVTKIVAAEVEVSLFTMNIFENGVAAACAEHNIMVVAYSPVGRGLLSGAIKSLDDLPEGDMRRSWPRFQKENFSINIQLVKDIEKIASQKGCTPGQVAIAYVKQLSRKNGNPEIVPIPGATTDDRIIENSKDVILSKDEVAEIDSILSRFETAGDRYPAAQSRLLEG